MIRIMASITISSIVAINTIQRFEENVKLDGKALELFKENPFKAGIGFYGLGFHWGSSNAVASHMSYSLNSLQEVL